MNVLFFIHFPIAGYPGCFHFEYHEQTDINILTHVFLWMLTPYSLYAKKKKKNDSVLCYISRFNKIQ